MINGLNSCSPWLHCRDVSDVLVGRCALGSEAMQVRPRTGGSWASFHVQVSSFFKNSKQTSLCFVFYSNFTFFTMGKKKSEAFGS